MPDKSNFYVNLWIIRGLTLISLLFIALSIYSKISSGDAHPVSLIPGLTIFFIIWLICLGDMVKSKIYNLKFWLVSMFLISLLAVPLYVIRKPVLTPPDFKRLN